MTRLTTGLMVSILCLAEARLSLSQTPLDPQPCPDVTAEAVGCELIAWSHLQEPVPLPVTPPDNDHDRQEWAPGPDAERGQSTQTVTGVFVNIQGQYWLKISSDVNLLIDDWQTARLYEGRPVRIAGVFDANSKRLKVQGIAPLF